MRGTLGIVAGIVAIVIGLGVATAAQDAAAPPNGNTKEPIGYGAIAYDEYATKQGAAWDQPTHARMTEIAACIRM